LDVSKLLEIVGGYFNTWGYLLVFFGTLFENTLYLGLLAPGVVFVLMAGFYSHNGALSLPLVMMSAWLGTISGDNISFWIGRVGWSRLIRRSRFNQQVLLYQDKLIEKGGRFVLVAHFSSYARLVIPTLAGIIHFPLKQWFFWDTFGALVWSISYGLIGYLIGSESLEKALGGTNTIGLIFLGLIILWIISLGIELSRMKPETGDENASPDPPPE